MAAPFVLDGPINRTAFETYVERILVPELRPGQLPRQYHARSIAVESKRRSLVQPRWRRICRWRSA
jgi:hypothetical protein